MPKTRIHMCAEGVLVRRRDNTVAFLTNDNINMMSRTPTPRPGPPLKPVISKPLVRQPSVNFKLNFKPLVSQPSLVRQPSLNHTGPPPGLPPGKIPNHTGPPHGAPPIKSSPKFAPKVGEKRNISSQELKIIIDSINVIQDKIRYGNLTCEDKIDYQIQLMKLSKKLC